MYRVNTGAAVNVLPQDPFPSVSILSNLPIAFGGQAVVSGTVNIQLLGALGPGDVMSRTVTADGAYYVLDGHLHAVPGQPVQPLLYADVTAAGMPVRSALFLSGAYQTLPDFDPVIVAPVNDYVTQTVEAALDRAGWYPPILAGLQGQADRTNLVVQMGQYDSTSRQERLYSTLAIDLYYSLSVDQSPPQVTLVDGLYNQTTHRVGVKVGATDPAGIQRVIATYTRGDGEWDSVELSFDATMYKWTGEFPGGVNLRYYVQVVDGAGNVAQATNKGVYFTPALDLSPGFCSVYLPLVLK